MYQFARAAAEQAGGEIEQDFVGEVLFQKGTGERSARFDEGVVDATRAQFVQKRGQRHAAADQRQAQPFDVRGVVRRARIHAADDEDGRGVVENGGIARRAQAAVDDDAQRRLVRQFGRVTRGQASVVADDAAGAGDDGVGGEAVVMHVGARRFAGNPLAFAVGECGFAIERGGEFDGDKRAPCSDAAEETAVERLRFFFADAFGDVNTRRLQAGDALSGNERVGVAAGDDDAGDASGNQRVGTGRGAALMRAGFEADVGGGATGGGARFAQGVRFGVRLTGADVKAFADGFTAFDDHAADTRVRCGGEDALSCQFEGGLHPGDVLCGGGHGWWFPAFLVQGDGGRNLHTPERSWCMYMYRPGQRILAPPSCHKAKALNSAAVRRWC